MLLFLSSSALAATISPGDSLREAIASAQEGETIHLAGPAVFEGSVVLDKAVHIVGENWPVLDGARSGTVLLITAPGASVSGLAVQNSGTNLAEFDSAIRIEAHGAKVVNSRIDNGGFGVFIRGADRATIRSNLIVGVGGSVGGNGIHLWKTKENEITGNTIEAKRDGIYLSYADRNTIRGNAVRQCRFGIHYMYSHYNRLQNNSLSRNTVGATLMFARHCEVSGNEVSENKRHGILLKQVENSMISDNRVSGHNRGLFVQQAAQDRFEGNLISGNDMGLYLSSGSEQNVFVGNSFIDNVDQVWQPTDEFDRGRYAANAFFEKGRGNFWSDYTGRDRNHDGIGDTAYHETDLYGYILDRHPEARLFALSPAATLLRKGEELLPLQVAGVTDLFPLMKPAKPKAMLGRAQ